MVTGAVPSNLHIGSRSGTMADYFSQRSGPSLPSDGRTTSVWIFTALWPSASGSGLGPASTSPVQVKSEPDAWILRGRGLGPLARAQREPDLTLHREQEGEPARVFHTFGRFSVSARPSPFQTRPEAWRWRSRKFCSWDKSGEIDLSAPIIRASVTEFFDEAKHEQFRSVLARVAPVRATEPRLPAYGHRAVPDAARVLHQRVPRRVLARSVGTRRMPARSSSASSALQRPPTA